MYQLKKLYQSGIINALKNEFNIKNNMLIPKLEKIVISVGAGKYAKDEKIILNIQENVSLLAGQKAVIIRSKKSVASFKIRTGMYSGVKVTLRGNNMYNFLEKLIVISLPKVRDFRGISPNGFDGRGNYNFGVDEQLIFPEIMYDNIVISHGMNISISTTTNNDKQAFRLLQLFGMPFIRRKI